MSLISKTFRENNFIVSSEIRDSIVAEFVFLEDVDVGVSTCLVIVVEDGVVTCTADDRVVRADDFDIVIARASVNFIVIDGRIVVTYKLARFIVVNFFVVSLNDIVACARAD